MAKEVKTPAVEKEVKVKTMFLLNRNEKRYIYIKKSELIKTNKPVKLGSMDESHAAIAPDATVEVLESVGKKLLQNYKADFINLQAKLE